MSAAIKKRKKPRDKNNKNLLDEKLWKAFSLYIRNRDKGICFTCGIRRPVREMQAGHLFSRSYHFIKFDEKNVHCQCMPCNVFKHGNLVEYYRNFVARYGIEEYERLESTKNEPAKRTVEWYNEKIEYYKSLLDD